LTSHLFHPYIAPNTARSVPTVNKARNAKPLDSYPRIWRVVSSIPEGRVASYGAVAKQAGFPSQPRLAGYALHNLPEGIDIPWHRVINAQGRVSLGGETGVRQRQLLESEGVVFVRDRVDLKKFGWRCRKQSVGTRRSRSR
jgi:methylated-DNA-protein-cysteine methyltransferase related protein